MKQFSSYVSPLLPVLAIVLLLLCASALANRLLTWHARDQLNASYYLSQESERVTAQIFRELRCTVSDFMMLKTEEYIHDGVRHRDLADDDDHHHAASSQQPKSLAQDSPAPPHKSSNNDDSFENQKSEQIHGEARFLGLHDEEHTHGGTLIPHAEEDFRGILGRIQRLTHPFLSEHTISQNPEELLPWFRVAILSNPHNIRAYRGAAFFLSSYLHRPERALEVIQDGLRFNPESPELSMVLGRLHFYAFKRPHIALKHFRRVAAMWENEKQTRTWSAEETFSVLQSYAHIAYCYKRLGDIPKALEACQNGLLQFPDSKGLAKYVQILKDPTRLKKRRKER